MDNFDLAQNFALNMAIQACTCEEIDRATEDHGQFITHLLQGNQTNAGTGCEVNQDIDIAVVTKITANHGTEKRQLPHSMGTAEFSNCIAGDRYSRSHL
jgi:hypothetical protein